MSILHLDIETFSEEDLSDAGVYKYAEHPSTEVNMLGYCLDDGPVHLWLPFDNVSPTIVAALQALKPNAILEFQRTIPINFSSVWNNPAVQKRAHNAQFERVVLGGVAGQKLGLSVRPIPEWVCTAVKAASNGIPRALGEAAKALGTHAKDDAGKINMLQLAKPKRPSKADPSVRYTLSNAPEKWISTMSYNIDDVEAERELDNALPDIPEWDQKLYCLDQKINEVGWAADLVAVDNILFVVEQYKEQLAKEFEELTWDWIEEAGLKPTQREKVAAWVRSNGFPELQDLTADYLKRLQKTTKLSSNVQRVLAIYTTYNAKSVSKLVAIQRAVCRDGRLRGMFMFRGAGPGRWSSLIVQLQNMMRPVIKDPNTAIEAFASRDAEWVRMLYPDVDLMKVAGSCIRGCLVPSNSCDLIYPDYSGIEDRVNLWFFDEEKMLEVYRAYDRKEGRHPYSVTVCDMFGLDLATFSDEDPRRQQGKVVRLAMGYEGGVAAFATMSETYNVDLEEMAKVVLPMLPEEALDHARWMHKNHPTTADISEAVETACNGLKFLYRRNSPGIVQGWKDLREAAEKAVEFEGQAFWLPNKKIAFRVEEYRGRKWLCMRLPSGRKIKYYKPSWTPPRETEQWLNGQLVPKTIPGYMEYWGIDTYTRQWMKLQTYGGKLDENADQGFSCDLLCNAMLALDAAGYSIVGSEHDKPILDVPVDFGSVDEVKALMLKQPEYAAGLPLATDGARKRRYGK